VVWGVLLGKGVFVRVGAVVLVGTGVFVGTGEAVLLGIGVLVGTGVSVAVGRFGTSSTRQLVSEPVEYVSERGCCKPLLSSTQAPLKKCWPTEQSGTEAAPWEAAEQHCEEPL
jgi:hypothetical protein